MLKVRSISLNHISTTTALEIVFGVLTSVILFGCAVLCIIRSRDRRKATRAQFLPQPFTPNILQDTVIRPMRTPTISHDTAVRITRRVMESIQSPSNAALRDFFIGNRRRDRQAHINNAILFEHPLPHTRRYIANSISSPGTPIPSHPGLDPSFGQDDTPELLIPTALDRIGDQHGRVFDNSDSRNRIPSEQQVFALVLEEVSHAVPSHTHPLPEESGELDGLSIFVPSEITSGDSLLPPEYQSAWGRANGPPTDT